MIQQIRKIGNSSGIIIPKTMLESCHILDSVEINTIHDMIILKPLKQKPRENWAEMFQQAGELLDNQDEDLFDDIVNEFDTDEW